MNTRLHFIAAFFAASSLLVKRVNAGNATSVLPGGSVDDSPNRPDSVFLINRNLNSDAPVSALVFVTKTRHQLDSFGGIPGADAICNQEAIEAGLSGSFVAWLSDSTINARDRLIPFPMDYRLADGNTVVAVGFDDLTDGNITHPIDQTADGTTINSSPDLVWTGTLDNGLRAKETCDDWTNTAANGRYGQILDTRRERFWTSRAKTFCNKTMRFYCFELNPNTESQQPSLSPTKTPSFIPTTSRPISSPKSGKDAQFTKSPTKTPTFQPSTTPRPTFRGGKMSPASTKSPAPTF